MAIEILSCPQIINDDLSIFKFLYQMGIHTLYLDKLISGVPTPALIAERSRAEGPIVD